MFLLKMEQLLLPRQTKELNKRKDHKKEEYNKEQLTGRSKTGMSLQFSKTANGNHSLQRKWRLSSKRTQRSQSTGKTQQPWNKWSFLSSQTALKSTSLGIKQPSVFSTSYGATTSAGFSTNQLTLKPLVLSTTTR